MEGRAVGCVLVLVGAAVMVDMITLADEAAVESDPRFTATTVVEPRPTAIKGDETPKLTLKSAPAAALGTTLPQLFKLVQSSMGSARGALIPKPQKIAMRTR